MIISETRGLSFYLQFIYSPGKPMARHLLGNYGFTLGALDLAHLCFRSIWVIHNTKKSFISRGIRWNVP